MFLRTHKNQKKPGQDILWGLARLGGFAASIGLGLGLSGCKTLTVSAPPLNISSASLGLNIPPAKPADQLPSPSVRSAIIAGGGFVSSDSGISGYTTIGEPVSPSILQSTDGNIKASTGIQVLIHPR